jgi:hypothetical protein
MSTFPEELKLSELVELIRVAIPDFHIGGHGWKCQTIFSLMRILLVGRTCGELVETEWGVLGLLASSSQEMSADGRRELLNDSWSHWNWRKTVAFGMYYGSLVYLSNAFLQLFTWYGNSTRLLIRETLSKRSSWTSLSLTPRK